MSTVRFSEGIAYSGSTNLVVAGGGWLVSSAGARITARRLSCDDKSRNAVVTEYVCVDKVDRMELSPDNSMVLASMPDRQAVQIFALPSTADGSEKSLWTCRINEGVAGLVSARWAPDSRFVITESDFGIQLTIWSIIDSSSAVITHPKQSGIIAFSGDGKMMAVGLRMDLQDYIGIYSYIPHQTPPIGSRTSNKSHHHADLHDGAGVAAGWTEVNKFKCRTNDLASLCFTVSGNRILATDSHLCYKFTVYMPSGEVTS